MSDAPELKPCPFCGQKPREYMAQAFVGTEVPVSYECANIGCPSNFPTPYAIEADAVEMWNRSVTIHPAVLAELPEVQKMLEEAYNKGWNESLDANG
jgi:hypothetical protein